MNEDRKHVGWCAAGAIFALLGGGLLVLPIGCGLPASFSDHRSNVREARDASPAFAGEDALGWSASLASRGRMPVTDDPDGRSSWRDGSPSSSALLATPPSPYEEVWIIERTAPEAREGAEVQPGSGHMVARQPGTGVVVPVPLQHTGVNAAIRGLLATVTVRQQFYNPHDGMIEALYVFPLPQSAAVNEFVMSIGARRIRGIMRERSEAEQIYREARRQGYMASLLAPAPRNLFAQSLANLEARKQIDVTITYYQTLSYADGWFEWLFPMVVGPPFVPPGWTEGAEAVSPESPGDHDLRPVVPCLKLGERSGRDITLEATVDAGVRIEEFSCRSHVVAATQPTPGQLRVNLIPDDRVPNTDFVLRFRIADTEPRPALITHRDDRGGFFALTLYPPGDLTTFQRQPIELVCVLDCSASVDGWPMDLAKLAAERAIQQLRPTDTFQIIPFSEICPGAGVSPLAATSENVQLGLKHLWALTSGVGMTMFSAIKAALDLPPDPGRLRFVCLLTDGYIGDEMEVLSAIEEKLGAARIVSLGIGASVNGPLIKRMAAVGRGAVACFGPNDAVDRVMDSLLERISCPALTDVEFDWGGWEVQEVFPRRVPDVFFGRPVLLTGLFRSAHAGRIPGRIYVKGKAGGKPIAWEIPCPKATEFSLCPALPAVWARNKIADLADQFVLEGRSELPGRIKSLALDYNLLSAWTAFVAVDSSRRTAAAGTASPEVPAGLEDRRMIQNR